LTGDAGQFDECRILTNAAASLLKDRDPPIRPVFGCSPDYQQVKSGRSEDPMVINKQRLGCILFFGVLLNLIGNFLAYRTAVFFVGPQPAVSLECFDLLRAGMAEDDARTILEPPQVIWFFSGPDPAPPPPPPLRHREIQFREKDLEVLLVFDNGILTAGRATENGQVVRQHLEPDEPILDPIRVGLRRLEQ
jgi:hypothetical protein